MKNKILMALGGLAIIVAIMLEEKPPAPPVATEPTVYRAAFLSGERTPLGEALAEQIPAEEQERIEDATLTINKGAARLTLSYKDGAEAATATVMLHYGMASAMRVESLRVTFMTRPDHWECATESVTAPVRFGGLIDMPAVMCAAPAIPTQWMHAAGPAIESQVAAALSR